MENTRINNDDMNEQKYHGNINSLYQPHVAFKFKYILMLSWRHFSVSRGFLISDFIFFYSYSDELIGFKSIWNYCKLVCVRETFASSEGWDLSGFGSDIVDDGILEPGDSEKKRQTQSQQLKLRLSLKQCQHFLSNCVLRSYSNVPPNLTVLQGLEFKCYPGLICMCHVILYKWSSKVKVSNSTVIPEVQPFSKNCVHLHPPNPVEDDCSLSSFNYNTHTHMVHTWTSRRILWIKEFVAMYLCMWLLSPHKLELQLQAVVWHLDQPPEVLTTSSPRSAAAAAENPERQKHRKHAFSSKSTDCDGDSFRRTFMQIQNNLDANHVSWHAPTPNRNNATV